jgi:hypothetical protein
MFTVEFEHDASIIRTMDESAIFEDIEVIIGDEGVVYMRQYEEAEKSYQMLMLTYQQLLDIAASIRTPEGMHKIVRGENRHDGTSISKDSVK